MLLWQRESLLQDGGTGCPPSSRDHLQSPVAVSQPACQQFSLIVASPTLGAHPRAERRRGYNQAELLARGLADSHGGLKVVARTRRAPSASILEQGFTLPEEHEAEESDLPQIVKVKQFMVKPMSPEEAALQLELVGHDFFVFTDVDTQDTAVVYKRRDGDYGLIEPQS